MLDYKSKKIQMQRQIHKCSSSYLNVLKDSSCLLRAPSCLNEFIVLRELFVRYVTKHGWLHIDHRSKLVATFRILVLHRPRLRDAVLFAQVALEQGGGHQEIRDGREVLEHAFVLYWMPSGLGWRTVDDGTNISRSAYVNMSTKPSSLKQRDIQKPTSSQVSERTLVSHSSHF